MKCDITFLLVHSVIGYPCFATSYRCPQKHGRKKIMSLGNFVSMTDHSACQRHIFFLSRFIQSQCSMTRMLIVVPRPSLMLIPRRKLSHVNFHKASETVVFCLVTQRSLLGRLLGAEEKFAIN